MTVETRQYTIEDIYDFLAKETGHKRDKFTPDIELNRALGIDGDDFSELVDAFAKRFNVDMSNFRWYFHHGDEASINPGALFFAPPYKRVQHIPVTPKLLLDSANNGKWLLEYPPHTLPAARYDVYISWIFFLPIIIFMLYQSLPDARTVDKWECKYLHRNCPTMMTHPVGMPGAD